MKWSRYWHVFRVQFWCCFGSVFRKFLRYASGRERLHVLCSCTPHTHYTYAVCIDKWLLCMSCVCGRHEQRIRFVSAWKTEFLRHLWTCCLSLSLPIYSYYSIKFVYLFSVERLFGGSALSKCLSVDKLIEHILSFDCCYMLVQHIVHIPTYVQLLHVPKMIQISPNRALAI